MLIDTQKAFTLIELIVVIVIIGILATLGTVSYQNTTEQAKITKTLAQIKEIQNAAIVFNVHTSTWPASYSGSGVNEFISNNSIPKWGGPYLDSWPATHSWKGAISWVNYDADGDTIIDHALVLDDDEPNTNSSNNQGWVSQTAMEKIDKALDDGVLSTGNIRGNGGFLSAPNGELVILLN